jgi:hypothetical protein
MKKFEKPSFVFRCSIDGCPNSATIMTLCLPHYCTGAEPPPPSVREVRDEPIDW